MQHLRFSENDLTRGGLSKVFESSGKQTKLIEGVFLPGESIGAHTHPHGEDCVIVLSGQLTYDVSNVKQIQLGAGQVGLGFQNVVHGYHNESSGPIHLLIFSTPQTNGLDYPSDDDPDVVHLPLEQRTLDCGQAGAHAESELSAFSAVRIEGVYTESPEEGRVTWFIDWERKEAFLFEKEAVLLEFPEPRCLLKYTAQI